MSTSEKFLRFAAECELMAEITPSPENEMVWRRIAERWVRCAELSERRSALSRAAGPMKRHRQPEPRWVH
jgi:hypothetical protein